MTQNPNPDVAAPDATAPGADAAPAAIRIVRGEPTAEELAAVVAVLAAAAANSEPEPEPVRTRSGWTDRSRYVQHALTPAPNGWRSSAFPR